MTTRSNSRRGYDRDDSDRRNVSRRGGLTSHGRYDDDYEGSFENTRSGYYGESGDEDYDNQDRQFNAGRRGNRYEEENYPGRSFRGGYEAEDRYFENTGENYGRRHANRNQYEEDSDQFNRPGSGNYSRRGFGSMRGNSRNAGYNEGMGGQDNYSGQSYGNRNMGSAYDSESRINRGYNTEQYSGSGYGGYSGRNEYNQDGQYNQGGQWNAGPQENQGNRGYGNQWGSPGNQWNSGNQGNQWNNGNQGGPWNMGNQGGQNNQWNTGRDGNDWNAGGQGGQWQNQQGGQWNSGNQGSQSNMGSSGGYGSESRMNRAGSSEYAGDNSRNRSGGSGWDEENRGGRTGSGDTDGRRGPGSGQTRKNAGTTKKTGTTRKTSTGKRGNAKK